MTEDIRRMYVSFSSSNAFVAHTGIAIMSLLENNREEDIEIFVIDLGIEIENKKKLRQITDRYGTQLNFIALDDEVIRTFLSERIPLHHGSLATYARLCSTIMYPKYVDRIAFIDSDMVIVDSLHDVYFADMGTASVAGVPEIRNIKYIAGESKEEQQTFVNANNYINCGFLVVDLVNWKKNCIDEKVNTAIKGMVDFTHKDQSILNRALSKQDIMRLPCRYNYMLHKWPQYLLRKLAQNAAPLTYGEIIEAANNPAIVHYVGLMARPWYKENTSSMSKYYYKYKALSPFANEKMESIFQNEKFRDAPWYGLAFMRLLYKTYQSPFGYPLYWINKKRIEK